jgi:hypothetical protein
MAQKRVKQDPAVKRVIATLEQAVVDADAACVACAEASASAQAAANAADRALDAARKCRTLVELLACDNLAVRETTVLAL